MILCFSDKQCAHQQLSWPKNITCPVYSVMRLQSLWYVAVPEIPCVWCFCYNVSPPDIETPMFIAIVRDICMLDALLTSSQAYLSYQLYKYCSCRPPVGSLLSWHFIQLIGLWLTIKRCSRHLLKMPSPSFSSEQKHAWPLSVVQISDDCFSSRLKL